MKIQIKNKLILIDDCDKHLIEKHKWTISNHGYLVRMSKKAEGFLPRKMILFHRHIMGAVDNGIFIDHKNRNKLDNRRTNLREATNSENLKNRLKKGVHLDLVRGKWVAQLRDASGKKVFLGRFNSLTQAVQKYNESVRHYHGEFAVKSSL